MKSGKNRGARTHRVQLQIMAVLLLFALLTTFLTGWIIYGQVSDQVIRDAWQQHESLLSSACMSVNQQIEQLRSFSWQLNNHSGVQLYLHLKDQTPQNILTKKTIIELMQQMKAFSSTLSDAGVYAEGLDMIITAESSYPVKDYFSRISGVSWEEMERLRNRPGSVALSAYVGPAVISRILSADQVLVFLSALPLNALEGKSYAFFHLRRDRLLSCLPESESGVLLLCDGQGQPLLSHEDDQYARISRLYMQNRQNRIRTKEGDFGVLAEETSAAGLYCMAIVPYTALLRPTVQLRHMVTLVMGACMILGLLGAVLASKRLYTPLERLLQSVKQLGHSLPRESRANEYKLLGDAIHLISEENHALTLSNREINRMLKNRLLSDWMEGRIKSGAAEALAKARVVLPYGRVQIAVAEANPRDLERLEKDGGDCAADRIEALAARQDLGPIAVFCAQRADGRLLILFNLDAHHPSPETIYQFLRQCQGEALDGASCLIGVGRAYGMKNAADSLVDAMLALHSGETREGESIALAEEVSSVPDSEYTLDAEQRLINQILSGRKEEAEKILRALCAPEDGSAVPRSSLVQALLFTARRVACRAGIEDQYAGILDGAGFRADDMPMAHDAPDRLCQVFFRLMDSLSVNVSSQEEKQYARLIRYIQQEYRRDISLDTAGEALAMSPSYIGLVFRRVGGTSFLKYLTDLRVEETKRLLLTTDLTLREIGRQVGIENQNTLIRTFKKAVGVTPGQFRMANSSNDSQNG